MSDDMNSSVTEQNIKTFMSASGLTEAQRNLLKNLTAERDKLKAAIEKTIADNLELADGDNCTLIDLKRALAQDKVV